MKQKSVSIFIHCFPPAKGGLEYLTSEIKKILDKNYTVHIITGNGSTLDSYKTFKDFLNTIPEDNKNNIHRLVLNFPQQRIANKLLNKIILKWGFLSPFYFGPILKYNPKILNIIKNSDIIIGTGMPTFMFYQSYLFAKKFNKKLILIPAYHNVPYYNNCPFFQQTLNYASKIFYLTPLEKKHLTKNYKIDSKKLIQTTFCPYTLSQIKKQHERIPEIITQKLTRINNKQINIGFIGQITPRKNLIVFKKYLDKYLNYWQSRGYQLKIHLSGAKTNSSPQIEKLFKNYIDKKTVFITYDFKDLNKEYSKFDIFINPSIEESLGIVNFEAIFHGLPTLVHQQSPFSGFLPKQSFHNIKTLHQQINACIKDKHSSNFILLEKYTYDKFSQDLINSVSSLV